MLNLKEAIAAIESAETAQATADIADLAAADKLATAQLAKDATGQVQAGATLARKNALHALIEAASDELATMPAVV